MRRKIYNILSHKGGEVSKVYEIVMLGYIILSIIPLMFREETHLARFIEVFTVIFFIIDYVLRWITADYRLKRGTWSFVLYPFTPWAIVDMLSILPGLQLLNNGFKALRMSRLLRILRVLKIFRFTDRFELLGRAIRKERKILMTVMIIAVFYVFVTALIMFNAEPHINPYTGSVTFASFFDALYWATVTLTTVGYGDVIPVTSIGRLVGMLSSLFGVAIIALPSGVITASYLNELRKAQDRQNQQSALQQQKEQEAPEEPKN